MLHITDVEPDESYLNRVIQDYDRSNDVCANLDIIVDKKIRHRATHRSRWLFRKKFINNLQRRYQRFIISINNHIL